MMDEFELADLKNDEERCIQSTIHECERCNERFDEEDIDIKNGEWLCRYCEKERK